MMDDFKKKFRIEELLITRIGIWNISLRPKQVTLGSLVLSANVKRPELSDLTAEETKDLNEAFKVIGKLLKGQLGASRLNYLALMMVDFQAHFHVIPRYETAVVFEGKEYKDVFWPKPPDVTQAMDFSEENLEILRELLRKKI